MTIDILFKEFIVSGHAMHGNRFVIKCNCDNCFTRDVQRVYDNPKLNTQFSVGGESERMTMKIVEGRIFP